MKSVQTKIIVYFSALLIIILLGVGVSTYLYVSSVTTGEFKANSQSTVELVDVTVSNYFENAEEILNNLSANKVLTQADLKDVTSVNELTELFATYQRDFKNFSLVYLGTADGKMIFSDEIELPEGYDPRERTWYTEAIKTDSVIWTQAYVDASSGQVIISAAKSIKKNGTVIGVLAADFDLNTLATFFNSIQIGESGYVTIIDEAGFVLSNPETEMIGEDISEYDFIQTIMAQKNGYISYTFKEEDKVASYKQNEKTKWEIIGTLKEAELTDKTKNIGILIGVASAFGIILVVIIGWFLALSIVKPIKVIGTAMKKARDGDLAFPALSIKNKDEIGILTGDFNDMIAGLKDIIHAIKDSTNTITLLVEDLNVNAVQTSNVTSEIAKTVSEIALGANEQAEDTQKATLSVAHIGELVDLTQELLVNVKEAATEIEVKKEEGFKILAELVGKAKESQTISEAVYDIIMTNNESAISIENASGMIQNIADQTNLLALNAAIEAARAGEAGRGFSIVADEIRKLAEQSNSFTKEIDQIIQDLKQNSQEAVKRVDVSKSLFESQSQDAVETENRFDQIAVAIAETQSAIEKLTDASKELNQNRETIQSIMENLSAIAEENAAGTEEVSASTEGQTETVAKISDAVRNIASVTGELKSKVHNLKI
jgi:methyl-accepting chemotaxis protein